MKFCTRLYRTFSMCSKTNRIWWVQNYMCIISPSIGCFHSNSKITRFWRFQKISTDGSLLLYSALGPKLYMYCWHCPPCFVKNVLVVLVVLECFFRPISKTVRIWWFQTNVQDQGKLNQGLSMCNTNKVYFDMHNPSHLCLHCKP